MKLGEMIKQYIKEHDLTYEKFGNSCGLSKGYISMIVNDRNPKTGKPPIPNVSTYNDIAKAMGMEIDDLFMRIDDAPVDIGRPLQQQLVSIRERLLMPFNSDEWKRLSNGIANLPKEKEHLPNYERAAIRATEMLMKYRVSCAPISPLPMLKLTKGVIVVSFAEIAALANLERDSLVKIIDAESKDAITLVKEIDGTLKYIVAYNMKAPYYVLQYALACELAHITLQHNGTKDDDVREAEAECFANYLLFPRQLMRAGIEAGIKPTVGNIGRALGCYSQCIDAVRKTPGVNIPKELNKIVKAQFDDYITNYLEVQKVFNMIDSTPIADLGSYMDNYAE